VKGNLIWLRMAAELVRLRGATGAIIRLRLGNLRGEIGERVVDIAGVDRVADDGQIALFQVRIRAAMGVRSGPVKNMSSPYPE
jgi:hypothetical protein